MVPFLIVIRWHDVEILSSSLLYFSSWSIVPNCIFASSSVHRPPQCHHCQPEVVRKPNVAPLSHGCPPHDCPEVVNDVGGNITVTTPPPPPAYVGVCVGVCLVPLSDAVVVRTRMITTTTPKKTPPTKNRTPSITPNHISNTTPMPPPTTPTTAENRSKT